MKVLSGHYSAETAKVVEDYPYGFRLRCKKRYWLEINSKGTRLHGQTTNPKKVGEPWNKPQVPSTYSLVGVMCEVDESDIANGGAKPEEIGHVYWTGLSAYDISKARAFLDTYREGLTEAQVSLVENLAKAHEIREAWKAEVASGDCKLSLAEYIVNQKK